MSNPAPTPDVAELVDALTTARQYVLSERVSVVEAWCHYDPDTLEPVMPLPGPRGLDQLAEVERHLLQINHALGVTTPSTLMGDQVSDGYVRQVTARYRHAGELPQIEPCERFYVRLSVSAHDVLRKHAKARKMSPNRLAGQLLEMVLRDGLVATVLDDGVE